MGEYSIGERDVELRAVDELIPKAENPRTHSDEQIEKLVALIRRVGWTTPIHSEE